MVLAASGFRGINSPMAAETPVALIVSEPNLTQIDRSVDRLNQQRQIPPVDAAVVFELAVVPEDGDVADCDFNAPPVNLHVVHFHLRLA
jgi:hypothetical protein